MSGKGIDQEKTQSLPITLLMFVKSGSTLLRKASAASLSTCRLNQKMSMNGQWERIGRHVLDWPTTYSESKTTHHESTCSAMLTRFAKEEVLIEIVCRWTVKKVCECKSGHDTGRKATWLIMSLWKVGDESARARARLECVTLEEMVALTWEEPCNKAWWRYQNTAQ